MDRGMAGIAGTVESAEAGIAPKGKEQGQTPQQRGKPGSRRPRGGFGGRNVPPRGRAKMREGGKPPRSSTSPY